MMKSKLWLASLVQRGQASVVGCSVHSVASSVVDPVQIFPHFVFLLAQVDFYIV